MRRNNTRGPGESLRVKGVIRPSRWDIACGAMSPELLQGEIAATKAMTQKPFGVNLITMHPQLFDLIAVCGRHQVGHVVLAGGLPPKGALEAIKELAGIPQNGTGAGLRGRMLILDGLWGDTRTVSLPRRPGCPVCGWSRRGSPTPPPTACTSRATSPLRASPPPYARGDAPATAPPTSPGPALGRVADRRGARRRHRGAP